MAFTVRFGSDEVDDHLEMLMQLKRLGGLKRVPDKSEVVRAVLLLLKDDPELQRRILDRL